MNIDSQRVYKAIVWLGNSPGTRVEVLASSLDQAATQIREMYGAEAFVSLWNEEDADAPRGSSDEAAYSAENLIQLSEKDGWLLGYIGAPWPGPWPKQSGDLFVSDPDGWQAGIAWETQGPEIAEISGPSKSRWGVYQVRFPIPVMSEHDLIQNFHAVLPLLKAERRKVEQGSSRANGNS